MDPRESESIKSTSLHPGQRRGNTSNVHWGKYTLMKHQQNALELPIRHVTTKPIKEALLASPCQSSSRHHTLDPTPHSKSQRPLWKSVSIMMVLSAPMEMGVQIGTKIIPNQIIPYYSYQQYVSICNYALFLQKLEDAGTIVAFTNWLRIMRTHDETQMWPLLAHKTWPSSSNLHLVLPCS